MKNEKNEREIEGEKNAAAELNRGRRVAADLAKCAIFVVLMIVSAFIKIPFPLVPLTFQTVVAVLAGLLLGPLYGTAAVGVYIFMGLIGLPVFTSGGGFAYVVQPTFGYILGFAAAAFVAGALCGRGKAAQITLRGALLASVAGFLVNYIVGVPYFLLIWHLQSDLYAERSRAVPVGRIFGVACSTPARSPALNGISEKNEIARKTEIYYLTKKYGFGIIEWLFGEHALRNSHSN